MKIILFTFFINLLFGVCYEIGETMSLEDQNKEFDYCYGDYPYETFKFADFNGALNGEIIKLLW